MPTDTQLAILAALIVGIAFLAGMFAMSEYSRIVNDRALRKARPDVAPVGLYAAHRQPATARTPAALRRL